MKTNDIRVAAMNLPDPDRAALARELIDSLDNRGSDLPEGAWAEVWGGEIASRLEAFGRTGVASAHADVMVRAKARLAASQD